MNVTHDYRVIRQCNWFVLLPLYKKAKIEENILVYFFIFSGYVFYAKIILMKVLKLGESLKKDIEILEKAAEVLRDGGVILYPTETIYGLGANALDEKAVSKIFKIKERDLNKPLSVLVRDMQMAKKIACIDSKAEKILESVWPGPITIVLRKKDLPAKIS